MSRKLKKSNNSPQQPASSDHFKKPLTNEQKFGSLSYHIDQLYKILGDINSRLIALSRAKIDPKALTVFMRDTEANDNFMKNLNSELDLAAQEAKNLEKTAGVGKTTYPNMEALKAFEVPNDGPLPEATV